MDEARGQCTREKLLRDRTRSFGQLRFPRPLARLDEPKAADDEERRGDSDDGPALQEILHLYFFYFFTNFWLIVGKL